MSAYVTLSIAIAAEVIATSALKASRGFTQLAPSMVVILGYAIAFYALSLTLKSMPLGIAYGLWSAVGIVLVSLAGWLFYQQKLDLPAIVGLALIIAGVLVVNLLSKTTHLASA
jgi:small multidrug resistance pump